MKIIINMPEIGDLETPDNRVAASNVVAAAAQNIRDGLTYAGNQHMDWEVQL